MNRGVLTLTLRNATPMLVGWYEPRLADPRGLREAELKGIWRYWARVVIAGALYDKGMLVGRIAEGLLRRPSREESEAIACYTGRIMGLGYAGSKGAEQSRFRIEVEAPEDLYNRIDRYPRRARDRVPQRVSLLTIDESVEYIRSGTRFKVLVKQTRSKYREAEEVALKILILSLQLQGVGKGGRRGLGSLDLLEIDSPFKVSGELRELINDIYFRASNIVTSYKEECAKGLNEDKPSDRLPPLPSLSRAEIKMRDSSAPIFGIYMVRSKSRSLDFNDIERFFVRTHRCRVLFGNPICEDDIRREHVGWFLGLPRSQRGTGYVIKGRDIDRRSSPIYVSYHGGGNRYGAGAYIAFSLSTDWPPEIEWRGGGRRSININEQEILKAYKITYNEFQQYIEKLGGSLSRVWP